MIPPGAEPPRRKTLKATWSGDNGAGGVQDPPVEPPFLLHRNSIRGFGENFVGISTLFFTTVGVVDKIVWSQALPPLP